MYRQHLCIVESLNIKTLLEEVKQEQNIDLQRTEDVIDKRWKLHIVLISLCEEPH